MGLNNHPAGLALVWVIVGVIVGVIVAHAAVQPHLNG